MSILEMLLYGLLICSIVMTIAWVAALRLQFYSLVDSVWAYGIGALALVYSLLAEGFWARKTLAMAMAIFWSLRLGTHLLLRLKSHYPKEDRRYQELRVKWDSKKFFWFFQFQGVSQLIFCLPFLYLVHDSSTELSSFEFFGSTLFFIGWIGETIADRQLAKFRHSPSTIGLVCQTGLWRYSRHPNYFFEWLVWCGISLAALGSPFGYIGLLSPILMYWTLNYLTGIPASEEQSLKSKGEIYRIYQQTTNRFFPWPPRGGQT